MCFSRHRLGRAFSGLCLSRPFDDFGCAFPILFAPFVMQLVQRVVLPWMANQSWRLAAAEVLCSCLTPPKRAKLRPTCAPEQLIAVVAASC